MVSLEKNLMETILIELEVNNAVRYSLVNGRIEEDKLEYYRKNIAEDSRYSFRIILERQEEILVKYRGQAFCYMVKENKIKLEKT